MFNLKDFIKTGDLNITYYGKANFSHHLPDASIGNVLNQSRDVSKLTLSIEVKT